MITFSCVFRNEICFGDLTEHQNVVILDEA